MRIKISLAALSILLVSAPATAPAAPPALETVLPASTDLLIVIEDAPSFLEKWETGPWGRLWNDKNLAPFTQALAESMEVDTWDDKVKEETGYTLTELMENLSGQAALVLPDFAALDREEETGAPAPLALVAAVDDENLFSPRLARFLALDEDDTEEIEESEEEHLGVTLHLFASAGEDPESGWTVVEGVAVVAEPVSYLKDVVGYLKGNRPTATLSGLSEFQRMRENTSQSDAYAYMNLTTLTALLQEELEADAEGEEPDPMFDDRAFMDALALDVFQGLFVSMWQNDRETGFDAGLLYREERGLVKLMAYVPGPCQRPEFIPDDVIGVGVTRFSAVEFWSSAMEILDAASPGLSMMVTTQIRQMMMPMGLDFEEDLIGSLGENDWAAYFLPRDGQVVSDKFDLDQVIGMEIKNPEAMEAVINGVLGIFGGSVAELESREVAGTTVKTLDKLPGEQTGDRFVSYAFAGSYMLIGVGEADVIDIMLEAMENPRNSIWKRRDLAPLFEALPEEASNIAYYDMAALVRIGMEGMMAELEEDDDLGDLPNLGPAEIESLSRHFGPMVAAVIKRADGIYGTVRMIHGSSSGRRR